MPEPVELTGTLRIEEWNQLLPIIGKGAYDIVAPLVSKLTNQFNAQLAAANAAEAAATAPAGNGATDDYEPAVVGTPAASAPTSRSRSARHPES